MSSSVYASPRDVRGLEDCFFYHTMEVPGFGLQQGHWDLREVVDPLLAHMPLSGKRVLEIGPASGFLTFEMERRGAEVVSIEIPDEPGWNFVPYPKEVSGSVLTRRRLSMDRLKRSYWLAHGAHRSSARLCYADAAELPDEIGMFDVALMANVLLHCESPVRIMQQCAARAASLIVVEMLHPELEGAPVCKLVPTRDNSRWDTWWEFSTDFLVQYMGVLGRSMIRRADFSAKYQQSNPHSFFSLAAGV